MPDVMISYARADARDFAGQLAETLHRHRVDAWLDTAEIEGGAEWLQRIEAAISGCKVVIAVRTPGGKQSSWVRRERLYALNARKPIIPVLRLDCPDDLELIDRQPVDFRHSFEMAFPQLLTQIERCCDGSTAETLDRRTLELAYLGRILLEHSIWQDLYTPMAGVAQIAREQPENGIQIVTQPTPIDPLFTAFLHEHQDMEQQRVEIERRDYDDILPAVEELQQLVVLGDPGSGKTTTLWRIAMDFAQHARDDTSHALPVFVRLGALKPEQTLEDHIITQMGELGSHYTALRAEKRLALLLDGLNELPTDRRVAKARQIKALVEHCQRDGMVAVVTCRELDYTGMLDMDIPQRVTITPLDPIRIRQFVNGYIKEPPGMGDTMFWQLAGEAARMYWDRFTREVGDDPRVFWLASDLPKGKKWGYHNGSWRDWLRERGQPRSMLALARNPYLLYMMTQVFTQEARIPQNRGKLFRLFVDFLLLHRERLEPAAAETLKARLDELAYTMQTTGGVGTSFKRADVLRHLQNEQHLYWAQSASILGGTDDIRFTHQLLQEYFGAFGLDVRRKRGVSARRFWPRRTWWKPTGWEEAAILLAGLYHDDCTPVLNWLQAANPELAGRCVVESGAAVPAATLERLRAHWVKRLTSRSHLPAWLSRVLFPVVKSGMQARAAVGRGLGYIGDPRPGVLAPNGIPDIEWREVPAGRFRMGGDPSAYNAWDGAEYDLSYAFWIAKYPVTYAQYESFVAAGGYQEQRWWTEAGWTWKGDQSEPRYWNDPKWHIANHPVIGVSWYETDAYTRWLNEQTVVRPGGAPGEYVIRLPRECEWEKAACYPDGRLFPWGNEWDPTRLNWQGSGIGRTSAVGLFPTGANPAHGACDLSGNVWEWLATAWQDQYNSPSGENNTPEGAAMRCSRGGAWDTRDLGLLRAAARYSGVPYYGGDVRGFRVVLSVPMF